MEQVLNHKFSNNKEINLLFQQFTSKFIETKLDNKEVFVFNFMIKNSNSISNLDISTFELSRVNLDIKEGDLIFRNEEQKKSSGKVLRMFKNKLKEINKDSDIVEIVILPEEEPTFSNLYEGLYYKRNTDSNYSNIPNAFTMGNYEVY
ncbi:hypothetical protein AB9K26_14440 [Psychroserpens sp. XS_ASV72]|uniref:hypothetical protein n=1 Tax=Psychroserpens sp. XS_ASV72 TaxID=3241293 RepID=UPI003515A333